MATIEELKKRVEEAKAKAALPTLTAEEEERAKLRAELAKANARIEANERAARDARDDELFERLEGKYAPTPLKRIDSEAGMLVLRQPSVPKSRVFQQVALKGKLSPDSIEEYVKPCVVCPCDDELKPDADKLEEMLEAYPLLAAQLANIAHEMATAGAVARDRKSA